ncbi:MAG TPA: cyclic nucleotide-binding domain-containing protein [Gaiellaceae bacterium]|jgi:CRP/FNR family transcriptional regulator, cyclic AMP receptor protein|nr:cyclic nucleotide-binding domain-containing protein [Gaiellaceae bacterium]
MQLFSHDAKADALAKAPLFRNLSRADLVGLAKVTEDLEVEEGKVLAREGDIGHEFFVLVDGEVDVAKDGQSVRKLGPGDFFGEIALIWESPRRTATVTAAGPVRLFVLTRQAFRGLIDHHPDIEEKVLEALEERVRGTESADA